MTIPSTLQRHLRKLTSGALALGLGGVALPLTAAAQDIGIARLNADASTDKTWTGDGFLHLGFPGCSQSHAYAMLTSGGKVLVAGVACGKGYVDRFNNDGSFDSTWDNGMSLTKIIPRALAVDSSGRVIVAGASPTGGFAVGRFTAKGAFDTSFGSAGVVTETSFGSAGAPDAWAVAVQADNKVIVAGEAGSSQNVMIAARYTTAGKLDGTYSGDGRVVIDFASSDDEGASSVVIDRNGMAVLGGTATISSQNRLFFAAARIRTDGSLDTSFDGDGKVLVDFASSSQGALGRDVAIDSKNRVVLGGTTFGSAGSLFALARLTPAGALDTSFDGDGKVLTDFSSSAEEEINVLKIQPNDEIVAAGFATLGSGRVMASARYNTNGSLDKTYSGDGKDLTDFVETNDEVAYCVALDSGGHIVLAGDI